MAQCIRTKRKREDFRYPAIYPIPPFQNLMISNSLKAFLNKYNVSHINLKANPKYNIICQYQPYMIPEESLKKYWDVRTKALSALHECVESADGCRLILPMIIRTTMYEISKPEFKGYVNKLIESVHHIVTRFIADSTLLVYKKDPIQKANTDKVEIRLHLIYNKKVSAEMGCEIAKAAATASFKHAYTIKNLYMSAKITLQPITAYSISSCPFCGVQSNLHCMSCKRTGHISLINRFKLEYVLNPDNIRNVDLFQKLLENPRQQIELTSLLTPSSETIVTHMIPVEFPIEFHKNISRKDIMAILSTHLHIKNTKPKDAKCKIVKITNQLKTCIRESIIKQHATRFYQVIGFHPEIEMYRYKGASDCVLRIRLTGEGSTYCPSKNTCFVRNCAEVWIHMDSQFRVWFRCDCGDCSNFHFGYDQMTFISKPEGMNKSYSDMFHNEMSIIHRSLRL